MVRTRSLRFLLAWLVLVTGLVGVARGARGLGCRHQGPGDRVVAGSPHAATAPSATAPSAGARLAVPAGESHGLVPPAPSELASACTPAPALPTRAVRPAPLMTAAAVVTPSRATRPASFVPPPLFLRDWADLSRGHMATRVRSAPRGACCRTSSWRWCAAMGEQYAITDPSTRPPATRNSFTRATVHAGGPVTTAQTVEALQRRGVLFPVCTDTVNGAAKKLAGAGLGAEDAIRRDIVAGILPGVVLVPAMVIAFDRMQARGGSYVYAG